MTQNQDKIDRLIRYKDEMERDVAFKGQLLIQKETELQVCQG